MWAELRPAADVVRELPITFGGQRVGKVALDTAKPNDDVGERLDMPRRPPRVLVGEGVDRHVGVLLADFRGHVVDQVQERPRRRPFLFLQLLAVGAQTVVVAVILRDRDDLCLGIFAEVSQHLGGDELLDGLVGDADLGVTIEALAVDFAEVLRAVP